MLQRGCWSLGNGLLGIHVDSCDGVMDTHTLVCPLNLGCRTCMLCPGLGAKLIHSHGLLWPLVLG